VLSSSSARAFPREGSSRTGVLDSQTRTLPRSRGPAHQRRDVHEAPFGRRARSRARRRQRRGRDGGQRTDQAGEREDAQRVARQDPRQRHQQTLYLFEKDKNGKSACSGACATNWPPLLTKGTPKGTGGVKSSLLGTTKRSDGTTQVTYNKHPLYRFKGDANKVGATKGEGLDAFGAEWYVVGTNGKKIEKKGS
jgi:predicted lipoprotein with Yx(FWY)xxD motif